MCILLSLLPPFPFSLLFLASPSLIYAFQYLSELYSNRLSSPFPLQGYSLRLEQEHFRLFADFDRASIAQGFYKLYQSLSFGHCHLLSMTHIDFEHSSSKLLRHILVDHFRHIPLFHLLGYLTAGDCIAEHTFACLVHMYNSTLKLLVVTASFTVITAVAVEH